MDSYSPHTRKRAVIYAWLPVLSWMALIFILSHQPKADLAAAQPSGFLPPRILSWSSFWQFLVTADLDTVAGKSAHVMVFGILAYLLWRARPHARFVLGIALLYGLSDEFHQLFIPGRTGKLSDVIFDSLGALLVVGYLAYGRHRSARSGH